MKTSLLVSHSNVFSLRNTLVSLCVGTLVLAGCATTPTPLVTATPGTILPPITTVPSATTSNIAPGATALITSDQTNQVTTEGIDTTDDYRALGYSNQRKIAYDSHGAIYIAYRKKYQAGSATAYHIFVSKSSDNGKSWAVVNNGTPIEQVGDYNQRVPSIAIDSRDTIHITWYGNDADHTGENDRQIKYVHSSDDGATWSPWMNVGEVPGYDGQELWQEHPTITIVGSALYILWQGLDSEHPKSSQIKLVRSNDNGATWSQWQNIDASSSGHSRPSLVARNGGKTLALLAYGAVNRVQQIIWSTSQDAGVTWTPWTAIAPDSNDQRNVSVASDANGHFHAVWRQGTSDAARIAYASSDGKTWSAPVMIAADASGYQFYPSIAVAQNGTLWAMWTETQDKAGYPEDDPTAGTVMVAQAATDASWSAPTAMAQGSNGIYGTLSWNTQTQKEGTGATWLTSAGSDRWQIQFATLQAGT